MFRQEKKHINTNFLVWLHRFVPCTNPICFRDEPGLSQGQTEVLSLFYTLEAADKSLPAPTASTWWRNTLSLSLSLSLSVFAN